MRNLRLGSFFLIVFCLVPNAAVADFKTGPVFDNWGRHAPVAGVAFDDTTRFSVAFDVAKAAEAGELNRRFDSLARFINMHVANGVKQENIRLALIVHGGATLELLSNAQYKAKTGADNANIALLKALMEAQVKVVVCGQSAAAHGVSAESMLPGVDVALSAMTAHAQLQQQGYTVNPF